MNTHKKVGKGLFGRNESWQRYSCEIDGYIYSIDAVKNYTAKEGWKIYKHNGGAEWVYVLYKQRKGIKRYHGKAAYKRYQSISRNHNKYKNMGYSTYKKIGTDEEYLFRLRKDTINEYDIDKTELTITHTEECVSEYFSTFRECLNFAENKLM